MKVDSIYRLVLASSSPRRQQLLSQLGMKFEVCPSDIDETPSSDWSPVQIVEQLAMKKAQHILAQKEFTQPTIVIGADTIVVLDNRVFGKPQNEQEAKEMLSLLQGTTHQVYSGVACIDSVHQRIECSHRKTHVTMKAMNEDLIQRYLNTKEYVDKAGSYAIHGMGSIFIESVSGCYFNVVGLPLSLLSDLLKRFDLELL